MGEAVKRDSGIPGRHAGEDESPVAHGAAAAFPVKAVPAISQALAVYPLISGPADYWAFYQAVALHSNPGQPVIDSKIFSCF